MPKYHVVITENEKYGMEIEAKDASTARDIAWEKLSEMNDDQRFECHFDSDGESTAEEIS